MIGYIYKIVNKINNKAYIGQTIKSVEKRFIEHCKTSSGCRELKNAIRSYGKENFIFEALISVRAEDKDTLRTLLDKYEMQIISAFGTMYPNGYNLTLGGDCSSISKESILRRAKNHEKAITCNETGQTWDSIKKCAESFGAKPEFIHRVLRGIRNKFKGLSFSYVNPKYNVEKKFKKRKVRSLDSYNLDGFYEKIEKQKVPIKCNETGQRWGSVQSAADHFGVKNEAIHRILRGVRKSFRNLTFSRI